MAKNTIIVYTDYMEQFQELTMEERGIILTAMLNYQRGEKLPEMSKLLKLVFIPIRQSIDRDNATYLIKCEKNRENGKLGGAPKGNQNAKKTTETTERLKKQPKQPDNDNDNDNENENDIDNDSGSGSESDNDKAGSPPPTPPRFVQDLSSSDINRIISKWNTRKCTRDIQGITGKRLEGTLALAGPDLEAFITNIIRLDEQNYLISQAHNGKPTEYDWYIDPENYQKVCEGKYKESYTTGGGIGGLKRNW